MSQPSFKELKKQTDDIYQRYEGHFAGKPRATRDLSLLDELIGELRQLTDQARGSMNGGKDPAMLSLLEMARENLEVYETERKEIVAAKERGPTSVEASEVVIRANLAFGRYHRHFAGKDRRTRDLGLLSEIVGELETVLERMKAVSREEPELRPNIKIVADNLELYRKEYRSIDQAQKEGTLQEEADTLATLANNQFQLYRGHFAGKSRHTRRTGLLARMIKELERIEKGMKGLKRRGLSSPSNDKNVSIVLENLKVYRKELTEIERAKESVTTEQLAGSLGATANEVMGEYREHFAGQNRATRDLDKLSLICDQLGDVAWQMRAIQQEEPTEMNAKNLDIVLGNCTTYEGEFRKIEEAKAS